VVRPSVLPVVLLGLFAAGSFARAQAQADSGAARSVQTVSEAYYQFLLAQQFENDGDIDTAVAAYQRAEALDPTAAEIPAELAGMYWRAGRLRDARAAAEAALEIDGDNVSAHRVLGGIFASIAEPADDSAASTAGAESAARQAIAHLEKAHRADGTDRDAGVDLALSRLYLLVGENQKASDLLNRVLEYEPDAGEAYVLLARAETALGHPERAIGVLEEASRSNPRLLATLAGLYENERKWGDAARVYSRLSEFNPTSIEIKTKWATALLQSNDPASATRARDILEQISRAAPTDPRPLYLLSAAERQRRDYSAAESAARRLIALDPDGSSGPFALAQVYEDQRLFARAADALGPAVARLESASTPDRPGRDLLTLLAHLGFAQLRAGRGEAAVESFQHARRLSSDKNAFEASLIQAYLTAKKYDQAAALARAASLKRPDDARYAQLEARALSQGGRKDRAVVVLRDAVAANPSDVGTQLALVQMLEDAGRPAEADRTLEETARKFPTDVRVPFERGALLEGRKQYAGAEAAFREALAKDPNHAPSLNYLGYMLAERGERLDEAVSLVERALEIDPENGSYLDSLGWAYVQQKNYDKAEPLLRRAAAQLPSNSVVQDHLGDALWAMGRRGDAVTAWRLALDGDREDLDVKAVEKKIQKAK
jgi:tetratricopeptide (TPR) repeat protein